MVQLAAGIAMSEGRSDIIQEDIERVINSGRYVPRPDKKIHKCPQIGLVNGLAVQGANTGILLEIEASVIKLSHRKGEIRITGVIEEEELGSRGHKLRRRSMVKESAENVITVLRKIMNIDPYDYDIHINIPGGLPIDGPSAGMSMAVAIYSALTKNPVNNTIAMTGEVSIRGLIKPVGGIAAKIEAALKAGAEKVLIPEENYQNIFWKIKEIEIIPIRTLEEAIKASIIIKEEAGLKLISSDTLVTLST